MQQGQTRGVCGQAVGKRHDDRKDHRGSADDCRANQDRLGRRFEGIAGAVVFFKQVFGAAEVGRDAKVIFDFRFDVRHLFDQATTRKQIARCQSPDHTNRQQL